MQEKLSKLLNVKPGEWKILLSLLLLLIINTMVLELSDVVATSGFVSSVGAPGIIWLWAIGMVITMVGTSGYTLVVDRVPRIRLVSWLLGGMALFYLVLQVLFMLHAPSWLTYPLLYILADQQLMIFPLAFWALASDIYTMSESKRLFPIVGAGYALGSIGGNGLAAGWSALFEGRDAHSSQLLLLAAVMLLVGLALLRLTFRKEEVRARQSQDGQPSIKETAQVGIDFFKNVPLFRYMFIVMLLVGLALTIMEYHFIFTIEQTVTSDMEFQTFYGTYKAILITTILLLQWLVSGRLLKRVQLKNTFIVLPTVLVMATACVMAIPGLVGAAIGRSLARLGERVWDEPSRKALQGLIPDERRGRIAAFLDSSFYVATIAGCLFLGILFLALNLGWLSERAMVIAYLGLAGLAAVGAAWSSLQLRAHYDKSLLNWRLARSRRKSRLDGIEF